MRGLVRETDRTAQRLVLPVFVRDLPKGRRPIGARPGHDQLGLDELAREAETAARLGLGGLLIFGLPSSPSMKGPEAPGAVDPDGVVPRALKRARAAAGKDLVLIADTCLCGYTDHGHCGVLKGDEVDNDPSLALLASAALAQAAAGPTWSPPPT